MSGLKLSTVLSVSLMPKAGRHVSCLTAWFGWLTCIPKINIFPICCHKQQVAGNGSGYLLSFACLACPSLPASWAQVFTAACPSIIISFFNVILLGLAFNSTALGFAWCLLARNGGINFSPQGVAGSRKLGSLGSQVLGWGLSMVCQARSLGPTT